MSAETPMKLLVVSHYFWPESFIINDLVNVLSSQKHHVTVATGKPNYPEGRIFRGYRAGGVQQETFGEGVRVIRVPIRPRGNGSARNLLLNYLSFVLFGLWHFPRQMKGQVFNAILVYAPSPITTVIPAIYLKMRKGAHLAVWVQDLWPESLAATGFVKKRWMLRLVGWLVRGIYSCSDTLLVQSRAFSAPTQRYAKDSKIVYYPNSVLQSNGTGCSGEEEVPTALKSMLETNFCAVFGGNLGKGQAVETMVAAAAYLQDLPGCKMVLVGSGSMSAWIQERKVAEGLDNLVLAGRFPMHAMSAIYNRASALMVTLKDEEIFSFTIPSKVQAYLAAGKPIVAALNGEGARIVAEAGAGLTCQAENAQALARCIRQLYFTSKSEREKMGAAGRAYFLQHFEMNLQAKRLVEILFQRIAAKGGGS